MVRRNVAAWPRIEVVEAGLWDRPTTVFLSHDGQEPWSGRLSDAAGEGPRVPTVTINQLMERVGAAELLMVKLIIEGSERAVFRAGLEWLDKTHRISSCLATGRVRGLAAARRRSRHWRPGRSTGSSPANACTASARPENRWPEGPN